jgi:hypothetical protein
MRHRTTMPWLRLTVVVSTGPIWTTWCISPTVRGPGSLVAWWLARWSGVGWATPTVVTWEGPFSLIVDIGGLIWTQRNGVLEPPSSRCLWVVFGWTAAAGGSTMVVFWLCTGSSAEIAVWYTVNQRGGERVDWGQKINSSSRNHIMKICTSTNSRVLFSMVNSDLAINVFLKVKMYYSSPAVRYTGVPKTIKR